MAYQTRLKNHFALAFGKTNDKTGTGTVIAEDTTIDIDNSGSEYTTSTYVYISDSSDANIQFLGKPKSTTATSITMTIPVDAATGTNVKVWQPATFWIPLYGPETRHTPTYRSGTTHDISIGGTISSSQIGDPYDLWSFVWNRLHPPDYDSLRTFLSTDRNEGIKSASMSFYDFHKDKPRTLKVRVMQPSLSAPLNNELIASMGLRAFQETDDIYVSA